jgi:hypothetical protein
MENVKAIDHGSVRLWRLFHNKLFNLNVRNAAAMLGW